MADTADVPPSRRFDIVELRSLCAAAELGSLGRAAIRLHVSQPALSKRLHNLEALVGVELLERSPHGVKLTPAGRRLYEEARRLLEQAERVQEVIGGLKRAGGPVRLAASHSAVESFVGELLGQLSGRDDNLAGRDDNLAVELVTANSSVVRDLVADGRADLGVAASRPHRTPYPGVREITIAADEVVCAVPPEHPWSARESISLREFLRTPMVMRDSGSNSRWTVDAVLRERGLEMAAPLVEAPSPQAAKREARSHRAPILVSRQVLIGHEFHELAVEDLHFAREFVLVLPAFGEPAANVARLAERMRDIAARWEGRRAG